MTNKNNDIEKTIHNLKVDWGWVKDHLKESERIRSGKKSAPGIAVLECADRCLKIAETLSDERIVFAKKDILNIEDGMIKLTGDAALVSNSLSSYLKKANFLYISLVTIGNKIEDTATKYMKEGDELDGYMLDRIGSWASESLAQGLEDSLAQYYKAKDLSVSMRLSPGYCDWPIEEQFKLAKIIDFTGAGVSLTKSCMMIPRKSITAVIGVGPKGLFRKKESQCTMCGQPDCDYRRAVKRV